MRGTSRTCSRKGGELIGKANPESRRHRTIRSTLRCVRPPKRRLGHGQAIRKYTCPVCQYQKVERQSVGIWSCKKCGHTFAGGAWEPFTRASDANNRILRRSVDGATTADMAFIAQEAAMNYERELANRPTLEEEE